MSKKRATLVVDPERLKDLRIKKGWTQDELAHRSGVGKRTISSLENGKAAQITSISLIAQALGVEIEDMLLGNTSSHDNDPQSHMGMICSFDSFIEDRTKEFVGRGFVFEAIDAFIENNDSGYFILTGDPGIGKSSIASSLVRERNYVHHFNNRAEGITQAEKFHRNICSQLNERYQLDLQDITHQDIEEGKLFQQCLSQCSQEFSEDEQLVIVVDALDEADSMGLNVGANIHYLPTTLPEKVYIIATKRPQQQSLRIDCPCQEFPVKHNSKENVEDIHLYLRNKSNNTELQGYISQNKVSKDEFITIIANKSEGNFMYLRHVLREIQSGYYVNLELDLLPQGLQRYYEDHWDRMGMRSPSRPKAKIKIVYVLGEVLSPVSRKLLAKFTDVEESLVQDVLDEWMEFLHCQIVEKPKRYSVYHSSFREFLNRKDVIQAAGISIKEVNGMIADKLYFDLFDVE